MKRSTPLSPSGFFAILLFVSLAVFLSAHRIPAPLALAEEGDTVRGVVVSELALYPERNLEQEACAYLPVGCPVQAMDMGDGWFGALLDGNAVYYPESDSVAPYTAWDASVFRGAVIGGEIALYCAPSEAAAPIGTLPIGSTIQFCVFDDSFYMARLGDGSLCYIPAWQVRLYSPSLEGTLTYWAAEGGTSVFDAPDENNAAPLAAFDEGRKLQFVDFDSDWLMARMSVDGVRRVVFVPKRSVTSVEPARAEQVWVIATTWASGMSEPSWDSEELASFQKGTVLTAVSSDQGWYTASYDGDKVYLSSDEVLVVSLDQVSVGYAEYPLPFSSMLALEDDGSWVSGDSPSPVTATELAEYLDPTRFPSGTQGFFQFLVLSQPMGIPVSTLDAQLAGKGTLEGTGAAFHDAAMAFGLNEAYLISHALHETGNGWSQLAQGVWYDPQTQKASPDASEGATLVYNMYGYGAIDTDPLNGGARFAYEHGWTSPSEAVYGGAQLIARNYIAAGQDTLYKMLFHPSYAVSNGEKPWHLYATDIGWAYAQTHFLTSLLADYDSLSLVFEVPVYAA